MGREAVVILGSTGVSAANVSGYTLYSYLRMGRGKAAIVPFAGDTLLRFQEGRERVKFLLVDESSMIGCRTLGNMDCRLRQMLDTDKPLGDAVVYFFGDCCQLPPVGDVSLFCAFEKSLRPSDYDKGKLLVRNLDFAFVLECNYRSNSSSYTRFLNRVAKGLCTNSDVKRVNSRHINCLSGEEIVRFRESPVICQFNENVLEFNNRMLMQSENPIAAIRAGNSSKVAFMSSDEDAENLCNLLYLRVGARVMLRRNLNVPRGLANGTVGIVRQILYKRNCKPPMIPSFILVDFGGCNTSSVGFDLVPIKPVLTSWMKNKTRCTRYHFPITLSWSFSVHKSQSLGLPAATMDIAAPDFAMGQTYVALSRVSQWSDLALKERLSKEKLNCVRNGALFSERERFLEFLDSFC